MNSFNYLRHDALRLKLVLVEARISKSGEAEGKQVIEMQAGSIVSYARLIRRAHRERFEAENEQSTPDPFALSSSNCFARLGQSQCAGFGPVVDWWLDGTQASIDDAKR